MPEYSQGLSLPYGIQPTVPVLIDSWAGPYTSVAIANLEIPASVRKQTRFVHIIDTNDLNKGKLYWYKDGIADNDLVLFTANVDLSGKADLINGKIPSYQLPGSVDDLIELVTITNVPPVSALEGQQYFNSIDSKIYTWSLGVWITPSDPESSKLYILLDSKQIYRWSGSIMGEISASLVLGETSGTAYRGDRGKIAYDHSQITTGNPHNVTKSDVGLENVDNTSDANKPISNAVTQALEELEAMIGGSFITKTYDELVVIKNASGLVATQWYLINDFQTKHQIPNTSVINTGELEPLLIRAVDVDEFGFDAISAIFPKDKIEFNFDDNSCEDGTWNYQLKKHIGGTLRKGKITYRKDTVNNLSCYYDWRNVKFRRWAIDATPYANGNNYTSTSIAKSLVNGNIYIAKETVNNASADPSADSVNWTLLFDMTKNTYLSWTSVKADFKVAGLNTTNLIIGASQDFFTFNITSEPTNSSGISYDSEYYYTGFRNFNLGPTDYIYLLTKHNINVNYNNTIFVLTFDGDLERYCQNNIFDKNCVNNTFFNGKIYNNKIGAEFLHNIIESDFYTNDIGPYFQLNKIKGAFNDNKFTSTIYRNLFKPFFRGNFIKERFNDNIIDDNFMNNEINQDFYNNRIGLNFNANKIDESCQNNKINESFYRNIIGPFFQNNNINSYFRNNVLGYACSGNTTGQNFDNNKIGNYFQNNVFGSGAATNILNDYVVGNLIGSAFVYNIIYCYFSGNTIGTDFRYNEIKNDGNLNNINFTTATLVYANHNKTLFKNANNYWRLSYFNTTDNIVVTNITT